MSVLSFLSAANLIVNSDNGAMDLTATLDKVREHLSAEIEATRERDAKIEAELDAVFDKAGSDPIPSDALVGHVAGTLAGGDILAVAEWTVAVRDFLSRSPRFTGKRGRNGGVLRTA